MLCPNVQEVLKSTYDLMRKGRPVLWTKIYQEAFKEMKAQLFNPLYYATQTIGIDFNHFQILVNSLRGSTLSNLKWNIQNNRLCK